MIKAILYKNDDKGQEQEQSVIGFEIKNHGKKEICAAVSMITINTVNAIELFTSDKFSVDFEDDGYLRFFLSKPYSHDAKLLLKTLALGLKSIEAEYVNDLKIIEEVVKSHDET